MKNKFKLDENSLRLFREEVEEIKSDLEIVSSLDFDKIANDCMRNIRSFNDFRFINYSLVILSQNIGCIKQAMNSLGFMGFVGDDLKKLKAVVDEVKSELGSRLNDEILSTLDDYIDKRIENENIN